MYEDAQVEWSAHEHKEQQHNPNWFWTIGTLAIALAIGAVILNNTLLAVLIIIAATALLLQTAKKPPLVTFVVGDDGVHIGNTLYKYQDLDSFAFTEENILIKSKKLFMPYITIPVPQNYKEDVYMILATYIPEEDHTEPISDKIMESLGFQTLDGCVENGLQSVVSLLSDNQAPVRKSYMSYARKK